METLTEIVQALVAVSGILFAIYLLYLQVSFLKKGIRFFDNQEKDRKQDMDSEKNG